jgi:hypothetical protein
MKLLMAAVDPPLENFLRSQKKCTSFFERKLCVTSSESRETTARSNIVLPVPGAPKLKNILQNLVKRAKTLKAVNNKIAETMIKHDLKEIWDNRPKEWDELLKTDSLLHLAVLHQKLPFVEDFLIDYPSSVLHPAALRKNSDTEERYPLWYNHKEWDETSLKFVDRKVEGSRDIRDAIVSSTIRQEKDMQELMRIFQTSDGEFPGLLLAVWSMARSVLCTKIVTQASPFR